MRATVNMSPLDRRFEIDADRRRRAQRPQPAGDGMAVALRHLVLRRDREAHAQIDEGLELGVGEVVAVHDVDVRADQALRHQGLPAARRLGLAAALVHRGDQAHFPGEREVVRADLERRVVRAQHGHAERDQRVAVGQRAFQQALDLARAGEGPPRNAARRAWDRAWASRGRRRRGCRFPSAPRCRRRCARASDCCAPSRPGSSRRGRAGSARRPGWRCGCPRARTPWRGRHGRGGNIPAASSWPRPSAAPSARCACGR